MGERFDAVADLIEAAREGRPGAVAHLLESYRDHLRQVARREVDAASRVNFDASDVVQETLIKAHAHFGQFRGRTEPELASWLRRILAHHATDLARRFRVAAARRSRRAGFLEEPVSRGLTADASEPSPSEWAARREMAVVLADALDALDEDHREVIVLRSLQELEWEQVGQRLGRTSDAARMLWGRAVKLLRPLIEERL